MESQQQDPVESREFHRQALALGIALCLWSAALYCLSSTNAWRRVFLEGPVVIDLSTAPQAQRTAAGSLLLSGTEPTVSMPLVSDSLEEGSDYLLSMRVASGLSFDVQVMDRSERALAWRFAMPLRAESETYLLVIPGEALPPSNTLQISTRGGQVVEIFELWAKALHPAQRSVIPGGRLVGFALVFFFLFRHRKSFIDHLRGTSSERKVRQVRVWDALTSLLVFVVCFQVFAAAPVNQLLDARFSTVVSHQILTSGTLKLPPDFSHASGESLPYMLQRIDDSLLHFYPQALALLNVPFVAAFELFGVKPVTPEGFFLRHNENRILRFAAAIQTAVLCALLFGLARLFVRPLESIGLIAVFAFGTQIFSSVSRPYWSHAWAMLLLTSGLYVLLSRRQHLRDRHLVLAASLLSWSFFCRPPMSLSIIAITVFLLAKRTDHMRYFIGTGIAWGVGFVLYSMIVFGSPLPPYFLTSHLESGVLGFEALRSSYLEALAGTLVSPGRGLFVYVPITLVILLALLRYWRSLDEKALALAAMGAIFAHWQLISASRVWWGGQSFGPRLFADALVWFFVLAALILASLSTILVRASRTERAGLLAVTTLAVAISLVINVRGATAKETFQWRGFSFWDWRHPQFLGMPERDPPLSIGERLVSLTNYRNPRAREVLLRDILEDDSLERRRLKNTEMLATEVTHDRWTRGEQPAGLVVTNPTDGMVTPLLVLATWAEPKDYPIVAFVDDGKLLRRYRFDRRGLRTVELEAQPAQSQRLYIIWASKAWTQGKDPRWLGVQLRPPS